MSIKGWVGLFCLSALTACSGDGQDPVPLQQVDSEQRPEDRILSEVEPQAFQSASPDCPGFEGVFASLPSRLDGEVIGEHYLSCDSVIPKAVSHFVSPDYANNWEFSITVRDPNSALARPMWDLAGADESMKEFLRKAMIANIDAEVLMFDNCVNNTALAGLPDWHKTKQIDINSHNVCIGTDAGLFEDGMWVGRAQTEQYLYSLTVEGEKAKQFRNVDEAAAYMQPLFRHIR